MLSKFIINSIDVVNILLLFIYLTKKDLTAIRLLSAILSISILTTVSDYIHLNFIISYIFTILLIKIIYKDRLKDTLLRFLIIVIIDMLLQLIISSVTDELMINYYTKVIIIESIEFLIILLSAKLGLFNSSIFSKISSKISIYFTSIFAIYSIILKILWNYDNELILNNIYLSICIIGILSISQILIYRCIIKETKEKEKLRTSNEYNAVIDEIVQEIKRRQHDFINYKNTILGIVNVLDDKDIKPSIIKYMNAETSTDNNINQLIYIDNVVIRSIIYSSICKADKYNITFDYKIENNVIDNILNYNETSNVLSNLLNNAFDENMKIECLNKSIIVEISFRNNESHLIVTNSLSKHNTPNLNDIFKKGYSTKNKNHDSRGYGLYNVQQIVKSHNGKIKLELHNEELTFDIYFNNSSGKSGSP